MFVVVVVVFSETTTTISGAVGTRMEPAGISFAFSPEDSVSPDPPQAAHPSGLSSVGMAGVLISVIGLILILGAAFVVAIICRRNYTRKNLVMSPQVGSTSGEATISYVSVVWWYSCHDNKVCRSRFPFTGFKLVVRSL